MLYPLFRVACDSYYLYTKYIYDPISVLAASKINLLPYQLEDFLNLLDLADSGMPVRVLIAYETGLGKTILAGLFIKEMILRNENTRILIVTPPTVQYQWQDELESKFGVKFSLLKEVLNEGKDPLKQKWLIASMDTLKSERWLSRIEEGQYRWDIVVVDELHRATPENRRAQLIQVLRDRTRHMLALTATPHDGKEENFIYRLSLINRNVDETNWEEFVRNYTFRRKKRDAVDLEGKKIFPQAVITQTFEIEPDKKEKEFYWRVEDYIRNYYKLAEQENNRGIGLVATIIGRTVSSSIAAGVAALKRRLKRLIEGTAETYNLDELLTQINQAEEEGDDAKVEELRNKILEYVPPEKRELIETEKKILQELIELGEKLLERGRDSKTKKLLQIIMEPLQRGYKIIIFTQFLATLFSLKKVLEDVYGPENVVIIHGGMSHEEKKNAVAELWNRAKILVATDAAGESLNLQAANVIIHYEIPWNPVVYIQRVGRVYRYGQKNNIFIYSMLPVFKVEKRVLEVVIEKIRTIERDFDIGSVEIIGTIISEKDIEDEIRKAYVRDEVEKAAEGVKEKFERGKPILEKIRLVLEKAEAAKRHVRAEKLFEDKGVIELITEEDIRKYLFYFREAGLGSGNFYDDFVFFEIQSDEIDIDSILLERKPTRAEILDLKYENTLSKRDLKLDNPVIRKALYIGMCKRGKAIFTGDTEGYGEVRILKLFDNFGNPFFEIPVVIFNGEVKPYSFLQTLEPLVLTEDIEKEIFKRLSPKKLEISNKEYIERLKSEQRQYLMQRVKRALEALKMGEDYYKRYFDESVAKIRLKEIEEQKKREYARTLRVIEKLSEPIAEFWVLKPENVSDLLIGVAESTKDRAILSKITDIIEEFDPELWKKKRDVELAGMEFVLKWEEKEGRIPKDVSAEGRGYDIESFDPITGEKRRIEVKSFKNEPEKITLTENEFKAAKFYGKTYYLYVVRYALDRTRTTLEIINDPVNKLDFEIEYRPYYVYRLRKASKNI